MLTIEPKTGKVLTAHKNTAKIISAIIQGPTVLCLLGTSHSAGGFAGRRAAEPPGQGPCPARRRDLHRAVLVCEGSGLYGLGGSVLLDLVGS